MAELGWDRGVLALNLTPIEKLGAVHGDVRVTASSVRELGVVEDAAHSVGWLRWPGARWPGLAIGTFYSDGRKTKTFAVVRNGTPRGVGVELEDAAFDRLIVGCVDPEAVLGRLEAGSG